MISGDLYIVCVNHLFFSIRSDIHGGTGGGMDGGGWDLALGEKLHLEKGK